MAIRFTVYIFHDTEQWHTAVHWRFLSLFYVVQFLLKTKITALKYEGVVMEMTLREKENVLVRFKSLLIVVATTAIVATLFQAFFKVGINDSTNSLPHLFYLIKKDPSEVKRNDIIEFDYYNKYGNGDRFYYENHSPFVKKVAGVPGDKIEFVGNEFYINDFASGIVKKTSTQGDPLVPNKSKILGKNEFFVYTDSKDSFDSRYAYVGYVTRDQIKGKVILKWFNKNS